MKSGSLLALTLVSFGIACGPDAAPAAVAPLTTAWPVLVAPPPRPTAAAPARPPFENPGGMWMPHQMTAHAAKLRELGLEIDPAALSDPTSGVLSAVVSLGGCSASFVSPEGLVITNHHCATGALQHNSNPAQNLLRDGWLAKSRADEKNNGPQARVYVTRAVTDVTEKMTGGLDKIADDRARYKEIERRQKETVAACEKGQSGVRCSVAAFYEGASYYLVLQLEIRDVRLVWAPPVGVGNFGGEIDNWRWPRHTGDVSIFRAYVGKDGLPADYSPENVPYKPPHWLKIATRPVREGDLVLVAGYPGRTSSLKTKPEVDEAVSWRYPRRQKLFEDYLARLEQITKDDKDAQIRATSYVRRFGNALTNTKGQIEGLVKGGLALDKEVKENELRAFIDAAPDRKAKWGTVLDDIARAVEAGRATRDGDAALSDEIHLPKLMGAARTIVRMAEERAKPDAERDPEYQARDWARHEQALDALATSYNRKVDEGLLVLALERLEPRTPLFGVVVGPKGATSGENLRKTVSSLYAATTLDDPTRRRDLFKSASTADLRRSKDPLIQLALRLRPLLRAAEERSERLQGRMAILKPKYMDAMRAFRTEPFAPDANGTLRITYGTVRGYRPAPQAPVYRPFTVLSEVVAKNTSKDPFDVPAPLLLAYKANRLGPYVDEKLLEVPVDFLSDLHITGGNSGSATLDAHGDLAGLVFDGNYESMASDWVFVPSITRSIHVDARYVMWLLDAVFGGDHILKEMGVEPRID